MIETFKIKAAFKEIGKHNAAYRAIFQNYDGLERENTKLEKQLSGSTSRFEALMEHLQSKLDRSELSRREEEERNRDLEASFSEAKETITKLERQIAKLEHEKLKAKDDAEEKKRLLETINTMKKEWDESLVAKDRMLADRTSKLKEEMDLHKRQSFDQIEAGKVELRKIQQASEEKLAKVTKSLEAKTLELEEKSKEVEEAKSKRGDFEGISETQLQIVARKRGWDLKLLPYFINKAAEPLNVDELRNQLKEAREEATHLKKELEEAVATAQEAQKQLQDRAGDESAKKKSVAPVKKDVPASSEEVMALEQKIKEQEKQLQKMSAAKEEVDRLKAQNAQAEGALKEAQGRAESLQEKLAELQGVAKEKRKLNDKVQELQAENEQLKVALEELRLRLAKFEQLAKKHGLGQETKKMMQEAGLEMNGAMQSWLLKNVFERLYQDAVSRQKRTIERYAKMQEAELQEKMRKVEIYRFGGFSGPPSTLPITGGPGPGVAREDPQNAVHDVLMTFNRVAFPDEDDLVSQARDRVDFRLLMMQKQGHQLSALPGTQLAMHDEWKPPGRSRLADAISRPEMAKPAVKSIPRDFSGRRELPSAAARPGGLARTASQWLSASAPCLPSDSSMSSSPLKSLTSSPIKAIESIAGQAMAIQSPPVAAGSSTRQVPTGWVRHSPHPGTALHAIKDTDKRAGSKDHG